MPLSWKTWLRDLTYWHGSLDAGLNDAGQFGAGV